ncbi:CapA family protein [Hamadaea sp. NPDC050747]|uniref:CapA family protein n=1 Tax=Hamadaea sp. NPDC050747 TaxID=3155789 RepID=UPI0033D01D63
MTPFLPRFAVLALAVGLLSACTSTDTPKAATESPQPVRSSPRTSEITVVGAGDILVHPQVWAQAKRDGGFAAMFAGVRDVIAGADLALCHLETPVGEPFRGYPRFNAPPAVVAGIKATGFDGCSTASNHTFDQGQDGVTKTIAALDAAGLGHAGTASRPADAGHATVYTVHGVRVAHLAATFGFNGLAAPGGNTWLAERIDPDRILAEAHRAKLAGAAIVIVSLHWGTEYRHDPNADQLAWANRLAGSPDIDLILGHHAHVVQPIRRIKGTPVVFGLGNELARHAAPENANREGLMVRVTFAETGTRWAVKTVEPLPTWVDLSPGIRIVNLTSALGETGLDPARRRTYQAAYDRVLQYARS